MSDNSEIKAALKKITKSNDQVFGIPCIVDSVDLTKKTCLCLPIDESLPDLMNVRLMADNKIGFLLVPKVQSIVIVEFISNELYYVSKTSEVEQILLNGDANGGLIKIDDLVTKLNNLENKVNTLITTFNAHVHPGVTSGASSTATSATPVTGTLTPTVNADLENTTVKHGNG